LGNIKYEQQIGKNELTYWLISEPIWRDILYIARKNGTNFKIEDFRLTKNTGFETKLISHKSLQTGTTDEPFVNANMIELQQTGMDEQSRRQNVASFFRKELIDWRIELPILKRC
jgi:deoxyribodipyrimidine photo-lyase